MILNDIKMISYILRYKHFAFSKDLSSSVANFFDSDSLAKIF